MEYAELLPPCDIDAEAHLLGTMMAYKDARTEAISKLNKEDFYSFPHGIIFSMLAKLDYDNTPIDYVSMQSYLTANSLIDAVGGIGYASNLAHMGNIGSYNHYIKLIKSCSTKRNLINTCHELLELCNDPANKAEDIIEIAESSIFSIDQGRYNKDLESMDKTFQEQEEILIGYINNGGITQDDKEKLIRTGITDLDTMLDGGFQNGNLYILAARPAMGKSGLGVNLATNICLRQSKPVAIFSMEMLREKIAERIIASEFNKSMYDFKSGNVTVDQIPRFQSVMKRLKDAPMYCHDKGGITTMDIKNNIRKLKAKKKEVGLVVVDYLQLVDSSGRSRENEVSKIARDLKNIALELQVPVLALSQLNREVENTKSKKPSLGQLRDSGEIEQSADVVMFIYRDEYYNPDTDKKKQAEVIIAKHRGGPVGSVNLFFDATLTKFSGLERGRF